MRMKALTICQPWAWLIVRGDKRVENRTWGTSYRGPLGIHAGKSREWLSPIGVSYRSSDLIFGAMLAVAELQEVAHIDAILRGEYDARFPWLRSHGHAHGPWCWILDNVQPLEQAIPIKGAQGLWPFDLALDLEGIKRKSSQTDPVKLP